MNEVWLKELNKRNLMVPGEDCSQWDFATVIVSSSVLAKLSQEEQSKFQMTEFKRATNEIEHWARVEEICDFFGVEDPDLAGDIYERKFKNLTLDEEIKWLDEYHIRVLGEISPMIENSEDLQWLNWACGFN